MGATFEFSYIIDYFIKLLPTISTTLLIVVSAMVLGLVISSIAALPQMYNIPVLNRLSKLYVSFFRGTPILIQLFLFYYGFPEILKLFGVNTDRVPALYFVILTYALNSGAFMVEMIRASVASVDRGQVEAAYAIGMSGPQAFFRIVLPQAIVTALPIFSNMVIGSLKDTSLAFSVGVMEMTGKSSTLATMSRHFIEAYISLALIYFVLSFVLERLFRVLERRVQKRGFAPI
ncbi:MULTISPECIES: amino acid ABC transporter permease [Paenibacillus]|uniref:L-cystine transport system permease protein n=1 Tax=Paenibacillus amylolyticus TaxID=1451 RepID=A0AAP5LPJ5_PAEAM|nr:MULTISPECIES: amino acid ABC transporter permease [Paenibacillus]KQY84128.1 cysteine ABC transporter permease [Paenibacillus sp. Root52]MCG7380870.1 amino acid ABC transporter permease [Paenibacillus sp. ACRSA]MCM3172953.1 amino acid ABC transporter permease [Paenibacillus sp. MER 99-2]MDR6726922.1 L-cystine transport system permease protein [Paenibacillus amylolyticus]